MPVATTKKRGNKSQQIRDYHESHPTATGSEIAKALGMKNPALVYNVLSRGKKTGKRGRVKGATGKRGRRARRFGAQGGNGFSSLEATAIYVKRVGSIEAARQAIDDLQKLQLI